MSNAMGGIATNGDTKWCNLAAAYSSLPAPLQRRIERLQGVHDLYELSSEHPLVSVHPETGERVLFISPLTMQTITGLPAGEASANPQPDVREDGEPIREPQVGATVENALIQELREHAARPEMMVTHCWEEGDFAMWDNRVRTLHMCTLAQGVIRSKWLTYISIDVR